MWWCDWNAVVKALDGVGLFWSFWADWVQRGLWWFVRAVGCFGLNGAAGEEGGGSVGRLGKFGRLLMAVVWEF